MSRHLQRRTVVIVILAGGGAAIGLLVAYAIAARQHAAPSLRVATQQLVRPGDVRVNDWLQGHGRVISVEPLETSGVLVRTATELIVCRSDDEVTVLRRRAEA